MSQRFLLSAVACAAMASPASAAGIVHRYSFNDGTANDSVGTAHGTLVHGPAVTGGQVVFDPTVNNGINNSVATGQYVDLPNAVANLRNLTVETWFTWRGGDRWQRVYDFGNVTQKVDVTPADATQNYVGFGYVVMGPRNGPGNLHSQISRDSNGGASDTNGIAMSTPLPTATEVHMAFVHDRDGGQERLYINGQLVGSTAATVDISTLTYLNNWIGRSQSGVDPFFNGSINELRIYDAGLTTEAVQANDAAGPNGPIAVPEPTGVGLLAAAAAGGCLARRRRSRVAAAAAASPRPAGRR